MSLTKQYIWQQFDISSSAGAGLESAPGLDAPLGYRMHSWQPSPFANNAIHICWTRESAGLASSALAQIPPELTGPAVEWFKRWILKIM